jgi:hypothetical protein
MNTQSKRERITTVAASVAGEDLAAGDFVAVLNLTYEVPSYFWDTCAMPLPAGELVRLKMMATDAGVPMKVVATCLPFVYAKTVKGELKTLDLRRTQIVRLNRAAAKQVWAALRETTPAFPV